MKITKTSMLSCLLFALFLSCVQDDQFDLPGLELQPVNITGTPISIRSLRDVLSQHINNNGGDLLTIENELYITGYVVSSDEHGNFFEELIIQNDRADATAGVKVLIDANPLFRSFEFGRKVYVRLKGLTVGLESGQLTLGLRDGNSVGQIAESAQFDYVIRDTLVATIQPTVRRFSQLEEQLINTYIRLEDVQFNRDEVLGDNPLTYAGEPDDQFDGERILESCTGSAAIVFSTSTFADFASRLLPSGRGFVDGIFTYDFFGEDFNLVVNSPSEVHLDSPDRCDPAEVDCGEAPKAGPNLVFSEDFETQSEGMPISGNGWTNFTEAGTETWEAYTDDGTNASLGVSARMGSFMSGDDSSIGWLITPEIDFEAQEGETLSFRTSNSFADQSTLEVLFSPDWNGEPKMAPLATWELLPAAVVVSNDDFFGDWIFSGLVDLSCVQGSGYLAWKYTGSGEEEFDGTYELDEIEIRSD